MLKQRIITAAILAAVFFAALFGLSTFWFGLVCLSVLGGAGYEWAKLSGVDGKAAAGYAALLAAAGLGLLIASAGVLACIVVNEPSWPVFIAWSISTASSPRTSPMMMRSGLIRRALMTS